MLVLASKKRDRIRIKFLGEVLWLIVTDLPFMHKGERAFADAMGCQWMSSREGRQAIPPAYTEFIGKQLLAALG